MDLGSCHVIHLDDLGVIGKKTVDRSAEPANLLTELLQRLGDKLHDEQLPGRIGLKGRWDSGDALHGVKHRGGELDLVGGLSCKREGLPVETEGVVGDDVARPITLVPKGQQECRAGDLDQTRVGHRCLGTMKGSLSE